MSYREVDDIPVRRPVRDYVEEVREAKVAIRKKLDAEFGRGFSYGAVVSTLICGTLIVIVTFLVL